MKTTIFTNALAGLALALSLHGVTAQAGSLQDAVRDALDNNPQVLASQSEVVTREEDRNAARSGYYPSLDVAASYGRQYTNRPATRAIYGDEFVDLDRQEVGVTLRQNVFNGFATSGEVERLDSRIDAAQSLAVDTRERIALEAARAYLRVVREQQVVGLAQRFVATHVEIYDKIKLRSSSGLSKRADLDQAEGRLAQARANLVAAEANLTDAKIAFLRVVGRVAPTQMPEPAAIDALIPASLDDALQAAEQSNPALVAANAEVRAAQAGRRVASSGFYPAVDVVADRYWNDNIDGIEGADDSYGAYVQLRFNLINGGADSARKGAAASRLNQARDRRDDVQREVHQNVGFAWSAYESVNGRLDFLAEHAQAAERTRDAYVQQFAIGQRTLLDLLDSENELFVSRRDLVRARLDRFAAQYQIQSLLGRLQATLLGGEAGAGG